MRSELMRHAFASPAGREPGSHGHIDSSTASGEQTSSLLFRLEQLDDATDTGSELVLRFEEEDGIAKLARLGFKGLDVEFFHILTYT